MFRENVLINPCGFHALKIVIDVFVHVFEFVADRPQNLNHAGSHPGNKCASDLVAVGRQCFVNCVVIKKVLRFNFLFGQFLLPSQKCVLILRFNASQPIDID